METLTRLVTDSLIRHGFDRPVDPRRLQWSQWFRCDSPHSLLAVPSRPGILALAEDVMGLGDNHVETAAGDKPHVGTAALGCPDTEAREAHGQETATNETSGRSILNDGILGDEISNNQTFGTTFLGGAALQRCASSPLTNAALAAEVKRRLLAVFQFSEAHDMAFTLDRMFTRPNPLRDRLASGGCFLRFVVLEDPDQRRTICATLNQWLLSSAEKASGICAGFSSGGTTRVGRTLLSVSSDEATKLVEKVNPKADRDHTPFDSGASKNLHCPHPLPSGF